MDSTEDFESFKAKTIIRLDALQDWIEILTKNLNDMGQVFTEIHTRNLRYDPQTPLQTQAAAACAAKSDESKSESKPKAPRKPRAKKVKIEPKDELISNKE
jgi:hypothetical protein